MRNAPKLIYIKAFQIISERMVKLNPFKELVVKSLNLELQRKWLYKAQIWIDVNEYKPFKGQLITMYDGSEWLCTSPVLGVMCSIETVFPINKIGNDHSIGGQAIPGYKTHPAE